MPPVSAVRRRFGRALLNPGLRPRQVERDPRSLPELALDAERAAGLVDEAVHLRQPKAGALVRRLRREEGVEHPRQDVGRDAAARVRHRDRDEIALEAEPRVGRLQRRVLGRERDHAALRHGVAGIEREVDERELELGEIDPHRP